jgi:manganese-dependent inorganic pyrophosphatase
MKYIFWHTNPDTDAYCSAVVYAQFLRDSGEEAIAIALWAPNNETIFVFSHANISLPKIDLHLPVGSNIVLVDHNEAWQSIPERGEYVIVGVIDHHKIADFQTTTPVYMRVDAVGCTCTILHELFKEQWYVPTKDMAWLMLSAIISDTLYHRSPTTTERDKIAIRELSKIAWCTDPEAYSLEMFAAKSNLGDMPIEQILLLDYKEFDFSGHAMGIGVMETTSPAYAMQRKQEIIAAMRAKKQEQGLTHILFCVVDILQEQNTCFVVDDSDAQVIQNAFSVSVVDGQASLGQILSRKKQIVPMLETYFTR